MSGNGGYWSFEQAAWRVRDELIKEKCGSCDTCSTEGCTRAKAFRPQRFTDSPDNCCDSPIVGARKKECCSVDYSEAHATVVSHTVHSVSRITDGWQEESWHGRSTFSADNLLPASGRGPTRDGRIKPDVVALASQVRLAERIFAWNR